MEFEPISTARMLALMTAGGLFACVGLYLMIRPRPEGAARIELFGLKFESSSAGLLVFLIGAAFLAVTLFVPEKQTGARAAEPEGESRAEAAEEPSGAAPSRSPKAPAEGATAETLVENEPNDTINEAHDLLPGQRAAGSVAYLDNDWFRLDLDGGDAALEVKVRRLNNRGELVVTLFDAREQSLQRSTVSDSTAYLEIAEPPGETLYIRVAGNSSFDSEYDLVLQPAARD